MLGILKKSKDIKNLKWVYDAMKGQQSSLMILMLCNIPLGCFFSINTLLLKEMINNAAKGRIHQLMIFVGIFIALMLIQVALNTFTEILSSKFYSNFSQKLRKKVLKNILDSDYIRIKFKPIGTLMTILTSDINSVTEGVLDFCPNTINAIAQIITINLTLFYLNWKIGLITMVCGCFILIQSLFMNNEIQRMKLQEVKIADNLHTFLLESLNNLSIVKGANLNKKIRKKEFQITTRSGTKFVDRSKYNSLLGALTSLAFKILYIGTILWCIFSVFSQKMSIGNFSALLILTTRMQSPFNNLAKLTQRLVKISRFIARSIEICELEKAPKSKAGCKDIIENYNEKDFCITFKNVNFEYYLDIDKQLPVEIFNNFNLTIEKNKFYNIVGESGIGKTTLFHLMLNLIYPKSGEIKAGKCNISNATRDLFTYVPQNFSMFSGTIREVVSLYNEELSDDKIWEALKLACVYDLIYNKPDKLDSKLGENGFGYSFGECQRLAIARAIIKDSPIILLDEACSGVDDDTEKQIYKNLKNLPNKTILAITHHSNIKGFCDKRIVVKDKNCYVEDVIGVNV